MSTPPGRALDADLFDAVRGQHLDSGEVSRCGRRERFVDEFDAVSWSPNQLWCWDMERHEALLDREKVQDLFRRLVAAGQSKLGAA